MAPTLMGLKSVRSKVVSNEQGGNHGEECARHTHPDRQLPNSGSWVRKPILVVKDNPEPWRDHPSPLSDELGNRHDARPLMEIVTHLITHGDKGHAEDRQT